MKEEEDGSIEYEGNVKINVYRSVWSIAIVATRGHSFAPKQSSSLTVLSSSTELAWDFERSSQMMACFSLWCSSITTFYCYNVYLCPMTIRYFGFLKIATLRVKTYLEVFMFVSLLHYCIQLAHIFDVFSYFIYNVGKKTGETLHQKV